MKLGGNTAHDKLVLHLDGETEDQNDLDDEDMVMP